VQQGTEAIALSESPFVAETDQRGEYVDEGQTGSIDVHVYQNGVPCGSGVQLVVAQYVMNQNTGKFDWSP